MKNAKENYYKLSKVAQLLDVSNNTIKRWYQWYEQKDLKTDLILPKYFYFDKTGTKYFNQGDLFVFQKFQENISRGGSHYGVMAEFNSKCYKKKENV